eukprot:TRINITY_DN10024_c0_g1_i1.p1 TRINITY_DN10024_c0_g1~~TRINITY_DN10024_c0_g1_i1.p1  ORF type:complete len:101 (-),score=10.79 TRINITY_DN10024_c0_g1_i1:131-433(-)
MSVDLVSISDIIVRLKAMRKFVKSSEQCTQKTEIKSKLKTTRRITKDLHRIGLAYIKIDSIDEHVQWIRQEVAEVLLLVEGLKSTLKKSIRKKLWKNGAK